MKKSRRLIWATVLACIALIYLIGTGYMKEPSAFVEKFSVSEDGSEIELTMGVSSSIGFLRKVEVYQQQGGKLYLDCYRAFGGINGSIGAKNTFVIPLKEETERIALYRNTGCYEEVLRKDSMGNWTRDLVEAENSGEVDFAAKAAYANWSEDPKIQELSVSEPGKEMEDAFYLPVFRLESLQDLRTFREELDGILAFNQSLDEVGSVEDGLSSYEDAFFEDHLLLLTYVTASSGSFRFEVQQVEKQEGTLFLKIYQQNHPEVFTCDMAGWLMMVEVERSELENVQFFSAVMSKD